MINSAMRSALLAAVAWSGLVAQQPESRSSESAAAQDAKTAGGAQTGAPRSLPPGPLGLQPDLVKPEAKTPAAEKAPSTPATTPPAAPVTDPAKMAAPAPSTNKIPGAVDLNDKTYVIGAEDQVQIMIWNQGSLSGGHLVRPDGKISVPLVGDIQAAGLTPQQLEASITQRLKDGKLLLDPHVNVGLTGVHSKKYYINGEVNKPGSFDLVVPTRIMEALVGAGGFKDFANKKKIYILRGTKKFYFNFNQVLDGKHLEQNIYLEAGDIIVIR
jgi:polysaccharide export outer membrane protein